MSITIDLEAVVGVKLLRGSCSVVYARESETNLNYLEEIDRFCFKKVCLYFSQQKVKREEGKCLA